MKAQFGKRIYSVATFRRALDDIFAHLSDLRAATRGGRISRAFAERIMLAVTQVNGCRYCHYAHTRAALTAGVTEAEIGHLLEGEPGELHAKRDYGCLNDYRAKWKVCDV